MNFSTLSKSVSENSDGSVDSRRMDNTLFLLVPVAPPMVVDCERVENAYMADDIVLSGEMREVCPHCRTGHLKLVLRQKHVKREHMYCELCTRCFEAYNPDGSLALLID